MTEASSADPWAHKDDFAKREWESRAYWATLTDDQRAGIGLIVHDALVRLMVEQDRWLSSSVTGGSPLDVHISILLPELSKATLTARVARERLRAEQGVALLEMERRLRRG